MWTTVGYPSTTRAHVCCSRSMDDSELADKLLQDHFTARAALIALILKNLPDEVNAHARRRA